MNTQFIFYGDFQFTDYRDKIQRMRDFMLITKRTQPLTFSFTGVGGLDWGVTGKRKTKQDDLITVTLNGKTLYPQRVMVRGAQAEDEGEQYTPNQWRYPTTKSQIPSLYKLQDFIGIVFAEQMRFYLIDQVAEQNIQQTFPDGMPAYDLFVKLAQKIDVYLNWRDRTNSKDSLIALLWEA